MKEVDDNKVRSSENKEMVSKESPWFGILRKLENVALDNIVVQNPSRCIEALEIHFKNVCAEVADAADEWFGTIVNFTREDDNVRSNITTLNECQSTEESAVPTTFENTISHTLLPNSEVTCSGCSVEEKPRSNVDEKQDSNSSSGNLQTRAIMDEVGDSENSEHPKEANIVDNDGLDANISSKNDTSICSSLSIPENDSFEAVCKIYVVSSSNDAEQVASCGDNVLFTSVHHLPSSNFSKDGKTAESSLAIEEFEDAVHEELALIAYNASKNASYQTKLRRAIASKLNLSKKYLHGFTTWGNASNVTPEKDNIAEEATHPNNPYLPVKDSSDFDWEVL